MADGRTVESLLFQLVRINIRAPDKQAVSKNLHKTYGFVDKKNPPLPLFNVHAVKTDTSTLSLTH